MKSNIVKNTCRPIIISNLTRVSNLKLQRIKKRMTQKELANLSGVPVKCIGNYEQNHRDINHARADILYRLAQVLDCQIEDIMDLKHL